MCRACFCSDAYQIILRKGLPQHATFDAFFNEADVPVPDMMQNLAK